MVLFVPALMLLFSELDRFYGHFLRYELRGLEDLVRRAGFDVNDAHYCDVLGVLPWLVLNTWMGKTEFNPRLVRIYDALGVPLTRWIEGVIRPPFGKNILLTARCTT